MARNDNFETRACSLPPESLSPTGGYSPLKVCHDGHCADHSSVNNSKPPAVCMPHRGFHCGTLDFSKDTLQGCGDLELCSTTSEEPVSRHVKHSPSDSGSAFTDEDSGCQIFGSPNGPRVGAKCRMGRTNSASILDSPTVQSFGNRDEFLAAMTEDLAEWICRLYPDISKDLNPENFFDRIADGVLLCHHATELHHLLEQEFPRTVEDGGRRLQGIQIGGVKPVLPLNPPLFQSRGFSAAGIGGGSFWARDNVANFIYWCRAMRLPDSILFETEDLVSRKNLRSVIVCLLELARLGGRVGMEVPEIIYLEKEIDHEISLGDRALLVDSGTDAPDTVVCGWNGGTQNSVNLTREPDDVSVGSSSTASITDSVSRIPHIFQKRSENRLTKASLLREQKIRKGLDERRSCLREPKRSQEEDSPKKTLYNRPVIDMRSLDEIVREKLAQCTCEQTFPMIRLSEGRYLFGDKSTQIFIRILRTHVMVRVGGGWDTLDHFLQKYDECRKVQSPSTLTCVHRRRDFKKISQSNSSDATTLDTSNTASVLDAVSSNLDLSSTDGMAGKMLGEGNLEVRKKGREVIHTDTIIINPPKPFKCKAIYHRPADAHIDTKVEEQKKRDLDTVLFSRSSSVDNILSSEQASGKSTDSVHIITSSSETPTEAPYQQFITDTSPISPSSRIEGVHSIPIIEQVVGPFKNATQENVLTPRKNAKDESVAVPTYRRSTVATTNKAYRNPQTNRNVNSRFSRSTNNLTLAGAAVPRKSQLNTFSTSTLSLANSPSAKRVTKPIRNYQPQTPNSPPTRERAKSVSNLSSKAPLKSGRNPNVFERLSVNANPQRPSVTQLVSSPVTPTKKQQPAYVKAPATVTRRQSSAAIVKPALRTAYSNSKNAGEFAVPKPVGRDRLRRPSVARRPAEGSRIPCPMKYRSQSVTAIPGEM